MTPRAPINSPMRTPFLGHEAAIARSRRGELVPIQSPRSARNAGLHSPRQTNISLQGGASLVPKADAVGAISLYRQADIAHSRNMTVGLLAPGMRRRFPPTGPIAPADGATLRIDPHGDAFRTAAADPFRASALPLLSRRPWEPEPMMTQTPRAVADYGELYATRSAANAGGAAGGQLPIMKKSLCLLTSAES